MHGRLAMICVLVDFPVASEQFVFREIKALAELGEAVHVLTIRSRAAVAEDTLPHGIRLSRALPIGSPKFWRPVLTAVARHPWRSVGLLAAALRVEAGEGRRGRLRAARLTAIALHFTPAIGAGEPQVIHAHFASAPATLGLLLSRWFAFPFGFSVHARDLYATPIDLPAKAAHAQHIVACSRTAAEDLRKRLPEELRARVHAIYHGVEIAAAPVRPAGAAQRVPLILAAGRFEPKKGFDRLVQACALLRDEGVAFGCELVGAGRGEAVLRRQIRVLGLEAWVRIVPWRSQADLQMDYSRASVLAVPSVVSPDGDRDNIPNVILEALASETPVVASALPAIVEALGSAGAALLVPPGDARALADGLRRVCNDADLACRLRTQGRGLVEREFDIGANARRLLAHVTRHAGCDAGRTGPRYRCRSAGA